MLKNSLLKFIPLTLAVMALFAIVVDPESRWLRVAFFVPFFLGGLALPQVFFWLLIPAALWFHLPILQWLYPNQFTFEFAVIAWLAALALRKPLTSTRDARRHDQNWFLKFFAHPFALILLFSVVAGSVAFCVTFGELRAFSAAPYTMQGVARTFAAAIAAWNIEGPLHQISLLLAYITYLCLLARLVEDRDKLGLQQEIYAPVLYLSAVPIYIMAIGQRYDRSIFRREFAEEIAGTFQNGNHLSFFAAFVILVAFWRLAERRSISPLSMVMSLAAILLSLPILFLGGGRNAILGLVVGLGVATLYHFWNRLPALVRGLVFIMSLALFVAAVFSPSLHTQFYDFATRMPRGDRMPQMQFAWQLFKAHPWQGAGLGNFFLQADMGYDIHNLYLGIMAEQGVFAFLALLLSMCFYAAHVYIPESRSKYAAQDRSPLSASLAIATLVFVCGFLDIYLSFRYFLFLLLVWFALDVLRLSDNKFARSSIASFIPVAALTVVLCALLVGLSGLVASPQSRAVVKRSYDTTFWPEYRRHFTWHGPASEHVWPLDKCSRFMVKPAIAEGMGVLTLGFLPPGVAVPSAMRLSEFARWQSALQYKRTAVIFSDGWSLTCVCPGAELQQKYADICRVDPGSCRLYLGYGGGAYLSMMGDGRNRDHRFLSLATDAPELLSPDDLFKRPWHDRHYCTEVVTID